MNPSIMACRRLEGMELNGFKLIVEEIPLRFYEIRGVIEGHIEKHRLSAVIGTGQSGRVLIALERVALNVGEARSPYNCGYQPIDEKLNEEGPVAYFTRLPIRAILEALREAKIPADISNSAGTYG